jgi:Tol biopolymer transport system component/DNA-binding winged helix-turn-helix (wHTH) protein
VANRVGNIKQKLPIPISDGRPDEGKPKANQSPSGLIYQFGPYELDPERYELRRQGKRLRVAPAPMDLLTLLVKRRGSVVNREEIATRLWADPGMVDIDQGINTAVRRIREVLRDDPSAPRFIETVVGKGYRFIAEVKEVRPDLTVAAVPASPQIPVKAEPSAERSDSEVPTKTSELKTSEPQDVSAQGLKSQGFKLRDRRGRIALLAAIALVVILGVVYAVWRQQKHVSLSSTPSLVQITTNDSEQRVTAAAISPDGKWIAYADINGISLQLLQSGKTVLLKAPEAFRAERIAWFPDQTKILVSGFDPHFASSQIWTVFITGSAPQLFRKDARNGIASPDGARIAFTANKDREIWTTGNDGDNPRALVVDSSGKSFAALFWSGDGKRVSYLRGLNGLGKDDYESADASSGEVLAIEKNVTFVSACALADGRIFYLRDAPTRFRDAYSLWEVNTKISSGAFVSPAKRIASVDQAKTFGLTASDDGKRMSFVLEKGQPHVYVGTLREPGPTLGVVERLTYDTRTDFPGSWLHDNDTVLFESNRVGMFRLYKQRLQDQTAQELKTGSGPAVLPQVTPDGKWILYESNPDIVPSPRGKLFRIPTDGGTPEQVATDGPFDEFRCPLTGGSVCVLRKTEGEKAFVYYALDPVTGKGRELARTSWLPHVTSDWSVAPDASAVALATHDPGNPRIRIVPLNGAPVSHEEEVVVHGFGMQSGISWAADGKGWYVAADTETGTVILYVDRRGESHVLRDTPLSTWGVPSPDGSKLAFVDQAVDSNVWMWRLEEQR